MSRHLSTGAQRVNFLVTPHQDEAQRNTYATPVWRRSAARKLLLLIDGNTRTLSFFYIVNSNYRLLRLDLSNYLITAFKYVAIPRTRNKDRARVTMKRPKAANEFDSSVSHQQQ